jgi:hypothetical protein
VRDTLIFLVGIAIVLKQAGIVFAPPPDGPSIQLIITGGLFCNGPVMLQFLSLRFGGGASSSSPGQSGPESQSAQSPEPLAGGK